MRVFNARKAVISSLFGSMFVFGMVLSASAQNPTEEYREWQRAQREAQEEYRDWQRTRSPRDYRDYQQAQRRAQREYIEYQRSGRINNAGRGIGYGYGRVNNVNRNRNYRVYRQGRYYETNQRGAELLQRAVNLGYQQGYREGQNDRRYNNRYDYRDENVYRNGSYGYQSYVAQDQYQYYFQQGFQRGYEDGYNSQTRYGYRSGNSFNILGTVLNSILNLTQN